MKISFFLWVAGFAVSAFLIGGIPFGFLIGKCHGIDIREHGSHNIGATNVTRVIGKWWGKFCFLLDFLKGALPVFAARCFMQPADDPYGILPAVTIFAAVAGHIWPVYLKFKGGKGVATAAGAFLPVAWAPILLALILWVIVFLSSRYVSLGSICAAAFLPVSALILKFTFPQYAPAPAPLILMFLLAALAIWKHRSNIQRLLNGTESRFVKGNAK